MATVIDSLMISIGVDPQKAREGLQQVSQAAQKTDAEFSGLANKWKGTIMGLVSNVIAPVAGAFAIGKVVNSYMSDVSSVAKLTGAYSEKLEEWRLKRAQLARVTREDIELYKKSREALTSFKIAFADVSAKFMRSFMPVMELGIDVLSKFTEWINRNQDNIVRFFQVTAGVITAVFLPAILKTSAAMLASPLTWIIGALGALVVVVDDLVTYMQGGKSALSGFWSYFGSGPEIMEKLNKAFTIFKEVISVIWKPLAAVAAGFAAFKIGTVLVHGFISVLTGLKAALTLISAHPIVAMLVGLVSLIMWVSDAFSRAGGDWTKVLDIMKTDLVGFLNLFGGLGDMLANFFAPIEAAFDAYISMMGNVFGAIMNVFKLIWAYISGAPAEAKDKIAAALWDCIGGVIDGLKTYISEVWGLIGGAIGAVGNVIGKAFAAIPAALSAIFSTIGDVIGSTIDFILSGFSQLFDFVGSGFKSLGAALLAPFVALGNAASSALDATMSGLSALWDGLVSGITGSISAISDAIGAAIAYISGGISNTVSAVLNGISSLIATISNTVSTALGAVWSGISSLATSVYNSVVSGLNAVAKFATGIYKSISKAVSALWTAAGNLAKATGEAIASVWQAFSRGFMSIVDSIANAWVSFTAMLSNAFDKAVSFIKGLWTDAQTLLLGISQNIGAAFDEVCGAISDWFGNTVATIKDLISSIPATVKSVFDAVVNTITTAFSSALDAASQFFDAVIAFFARIPQMIADAFDIGGMIDGATAKLKESFGGVWDKAKSFVGFGGDEDKKSTAVPANGGATVAPALSQAQIISENYAAAVSAQPIAANTSSVVNNTSSIDNRRNSNAKTSNTNITINTNSDRPAAIARAVQGALSDEGGNNYVYAADNGNYNY